MKLRFNGTVILLSFTFIISNCCGIFAYGGAGHKMLAKALIHSLRVSGYSDLASQLLELRMLNGVSCSYMDLILGADATKGVCSPDLSGFEDPAFTSGFEATLYRYYEKILPYPSVQKIFTFEDFKNKIKMNANNNLTSNPEKDLQRAIQHTYCMDVLGDPYLGQISRSDLYGQAEYDLAMRFKETDLVFALNQLGRAMHYVQDATVPHHTKLKQNYFDLYLGAKSPGLEKDHTSQGVYENSFINSFCYVEDGFNAESNHSSTNPMDWKFKQNTLNTKYLITEDQLILSQYDYVKTNELIIKNASFSKKQFDYCDSMCQYAEGQVKCGAIENGWYIYILNKDRCSCTDDVTGRCSLGGLILYFDTQYLEDPSLHDIGSGIWKVQGYGVADDFNYVAAKLIPLAIKSCASMVVQFFDAKIPGTFVAENLKYDYIRKRISRHMM